MTNFASPKSTQAASGPAARAGPAGSRHKNPRQASTPTLAGGTELPSPKPEPMPGTPAAEKPVKAATWSAGPKRRNFQRNYASGPRGGPTSASAAAEHAEHLDDFEPSLSKNSRVSLNHLLNFRLPPRQFTSAGYSSSSSRRTANYGSGSWDKMTRDRYLNANNRFVVVESGNYEANLRDPDAVVDWNSVVQVLMPAPPAHAPTCPICLGDPVAPKCTQCGHVYCYPCILRHLSVAEKGNRRCPVCFDDIRERELRSVSFIMLENQTTSIASAGADKAEVEMILMHRNASSTLVLPVTIPLPMVADPGTGLPTAAFPPVTDVECRRYAKILLASPSYVAENVYEHEAMEMERLLQSDTDLDGLERKYLEMARDTSLGRMHAVGSGVPSGANPGAIAIPGLPARSSSTVASSPSSLGSPPQIGTFLSAPGGDRNFHFYQAADGSHVYLHPLDIRILKQEFGDYSVFPAKITARVQEFEEGSVNSDLRKRFRYLGHLPLGCDVTFAEIVLDGFVSEETLSSFRKELAARDDRRAHKRRLQKEDEDRQAREARRLQRIQDVRDRQGVTAPMTAIRLADLEPEEETQFDLADLGASLSTSPTYVPPTPMLSFARAITSPQPKVAAGKGAPWARSSGRGQPPPAELPRGITIGHEMGKTVRSRIVDEDDEVDEDSAAYVYHRSSSRPSSAFGLLGEDDRLQGWNFVEKQPLAPGSTEESGKKKGKGKKIVLVSNGGMRRK